METLQFRLKDRPPRQQAINWLAKNCEIWPVVVDDETHTYRFHGWEFIESFEGVIYFANCIDAGITECEFLAAQKQVGT